MQIMEKGKKYMDLFKRNILYIKTVKLSDRKIRANEFVK